MTENHSQISLSRIIPGTIIDDDVQDFLKLLGPFLEMNSAYFLVPGLRLSPEVLSSASFSADFAALSDLAQGAEDIIEQTLVQDPVLNGAAHLVWLWQVIAKSRGMPETAAFEWEADGGPAMGAQTWRLHSVHETLLGHEKILCSPKEELTAAERDTLHDEVLACVREFGFQLQQWADRWYLTRNKDWQVLVRPWCAQEFHPFTESSLQGPDAESFKSLDQKLRAILKKSAVNQKRLSEGLETIDAFWPDGGSRRHLLKPSTLRAVMANDSFVWGWAQNAGLLNFRTTAVKNDWPEAPEGDLLAVIDDLYVPYREKNWSLWAQKLPGAIASISHLWNLAHARRCGRLVLIASGAKDTHTVVIEKGAAKGLFSRFKKKKALNVESFLGEVAQ